MVSAPNWQSLRLVRDAMLAATMLAFVLQVCVDSSVENVGSNLLCLAAFLPTCWLVLSPRNARGGASLTAAVVFLVIFSNSLLPMIATLVEGHALVFHLRVPLEVFLHRWVWAVVLLVAQVLAASTWARAPKAVLGRVVDRLHVRDLSPPRILWALGGIGAAMLVLRAFVLPTGSVLEKALAGFDPIRQAPFILLVPPYNAALLKRPWQGIALLGFYLLGGVLGITSRMAWALPPASVAAAWMVALLTGSVGLDRRMIRRAAVLGMAGIALVGQLKDVSTAVLIERAYRSERSFADQASATVKRFFDKEALAAHERQVSDEGDPLAGEAWREDYIRNPFLARFILVKFDDNLLYGLGNFAAVDTLELRQVTRDKLIAQLPGPVLTAIGLGVDKQYINAFSMGDLMARMAGYSAKLGGFKVGSLLAHAYALVGIGYPVLLLGLMLPLTVILQTFGTRARGGVMGTGISSFALLYAFPSYIGFSSDGIASMGSFLVRGLWQAALLYGLTTLVLAALGRRRIPGGRPSRGQVRTHVQGMGARPVREKLLRQSSSSDPQLAAPK